MSGDNKSSLDRLLSDSVHAAVPIGEVLSPSQNPYHVTTTERALGTALAILGQSLQTPVRLEFALGETKIRYGATETLPYAIALLPGVTLALDKPPQHLDSEQREYLQIISPYFALALNVISESDANRELATKDPLTGLKNRRALDKLMVDELLELRKKEQHLRREDDVRTAGISAIMIDVDSFKQYNDLNGHAAGDKALRAMGRYLRSRPRQSDSVFRYGGEEFTVILPNCPLENACIVAEELRSYVDNQSAEDARQKILDAPLTVSIGVAHTSEIAQAYRFGREPPFGGHDFILLELADRRLYEAKRAGRNRVNSTAIPQSLEGQLASTSTPINTERTL